MKIEETSLRHKSYKSRATIVCLDTDNPYKYCVQIQDSIERYFFATRKKNQPRTLYRVRYGVIADISKIAKFKSIDGAKKAFTKEFPCKHINTNNIKTFSSVWFPTSKINGRRVGKKTHGLLNFDVNAWLYNR